MNILFYKKNINSKNELKEYLKKEKDYSITVLPTVENLKSDLQEYEPDIIFIDYELGSQENFLPLKTFKRSKKKLYIIVIVPDFLSITKIDFLIKFKLCQLTLLASASVAQYRTAIKYIESNLNEKSKLLEIKDKYDSIIHEYNNYKKSLEEKEQAIKQLKEKIADIIIIDETADIYNERYFNNQAEQIVEECKRYHDNMCVIYLTIDNIEQINEVYGEEGKNFVLKNTAAEIKERIRNNDLAAISGDHTYFLILYKKIQSNMVRVVAERLKKYLEDKVFIFDNKQVRISVSMGLSSAINYFKNIFELKDLRQQAEIALNNAYKKGGDVIVAYA
ncbi:MAG TPA: GGDEF domain-containing protein [Spirochaetota bacterium]|nr:GGDEF domain-containing protein [Spirochaetota bacterium]